MLLERSDDSLDDVAVRSVAAFHLNVGFGIGLPLHLGEPLQSRLAISILE